MKKLLTASAVALMALGASADMGNGFHTSLNLGYAGTTAKGKPGTSGGVTQAVKKKTGHGFLADIAVGYMNTMSNKLMLGVSAGFGIDTSKAQLATTTVPAVGKSTYEPRHNFNIDLCLGRMLNEKMAGFVGLGHEFSFGRYKFSTVKDNVRTFSLVPHIGVMGKLQDKLSWTGKIGYKFGTSMSGLKATHKPLVKGKPTGFQAKVGVSYHF